MRIAFFGHIDACDPMKIGGVESLTRRLALSLAAKGNTVIVVMYGADQNRKLDTFFENDLMLLYYSSFSDALLGLASFQCDSVLEMYIHKQYYPKYLLFRKQMNNITKFSRVFLTSAESALKRWMSKKICTLFCNSVFAVSPRLVKELQKSGIAAVWLPPPVPDRYFSISKRSSTEHMVISYIGRIDPNKGLNNIISAFESLQNCAVGMKRFALKIYGYYDPNNKNSANLHRSLQRLNHIEYSVQSKQSCRYSPSIEDQMIDRLKQTDILFLPYENLKGSLDLPLLILEGLAAGCVVVSTNIGDIPEIIGNRGLIIKSSAELEETIKKLSCSEVFTEQLFRIQPMELFSTFSSTKVAERILSFI